MLNFQNLAYMNSMELPVNVVFMEPQPAFELHRHEFSELVLVKCGSARYFTPSGSCIISAGDIMLTRDGDCHGYSDTKELMIANLIYIPEQLPIPVLDMCSSQLFSILMGNLKNQIRKPVPPAPVLHIDSVQLETLWNEMSILREQKFATGVGSLFLCLTQFMRIIGMLMKNHATQKEAVMPFYKNILTLIDFLDSHFSENITSRQMTAIAGMSERTMLRCFSRMIGMAPREYLISKRIVHAAEQIQNTDLTISEIAFKVGFNDSNYFSRQFRIRTKLTPKSFRMKCRSE